ncbi:MAG: hypothetical protein QM697_02050 [Lachnospiraceae bacterium]
MRYEKYRFSAKEGLLFTLEYMAVGGLIAYLFYDSIYLFIPLFTGFIPFLKKKKSILIIKRKKELSVQFQEAIAAAATALNAGCSVENAFREAFKDMQRLYGEESMIVKELALLMQHLSFNGTLEAFLSEFAERSGIEDIKDFSSIFTAAKRNGGNFSRIIQRNVEIMHTKQEIEQEIEVLLSGKRYEQKIMSIIPLAIIGYLRYSTNEFSEVLYHNAAGIFGMSMCLAVFTAAYLLSERIAAIEV